MAETREGLLGFGGTISGRNYFLVGVLLTLIKQALDQIMARTVFSRPWSPLQYALTGEVEGLFSLDVEDQKFYAAMLAVALPFVLVGVVLTVRRLRDAGWPLWLVVLFFLPLPMNLIFLIVLSAVPSRASEAGTLADALDGAAGLAKGVPAASALAHGRDVARSGKPGFAWALFSVVAPLPVAGAVVYLGAYVLRDYGWSLFVGTPFVMPMLSVVIYGAGRNVTMGQCQQVGFLWILVVFFMTLAVAFEGIICLVMMLPLAIPIVLLGATIGYYIVRLGRAGARDAVKIGLVLLALMPTMFGAEHLIEPPPLNFVCETSATIDAPPEVVWRHVVSFSDLAPPREWWFKTGLAYPVRARIEGTGVGAIRRCEFSTGAFVEPIQVWDEPRLLRFSVTQNPPPMEEWNPFFEIHPPHLDGFLLARQGEFQLIPLEGGGTLLRGSTLYQHGLWPAAYWRVWSDPIIHRIHDRVLRHIKTLAETDARRAVQGP